MEQITISIEEYRKLKIDSNFLQCLEKAGLSGWENYQYATELLEEFYVKNPKELAKIYSNE